MTATLSAAERIEIGRACERLVLTYSRALDLGDMDAAADCFATNGSFARPMAPDHLSSRRARCGSEKCASASCSKRASGSSSSGAARSR